MKKMTRDTLRVDRIGNDGRVSYTYGAITQPIEDANTIATDGGGVIPAYTSSLLVFLAKRRQMSYLPIVLLIT